MNYPRLKSDDETERYLAGWLYWQRIKFHKNKLALWQIKKIKTLPHDLIYIEDTAAIKKNELIEMAKRNEPRPCSGAHLLGYALVNYTNPKNECYDPVFDKEIRRLAPHWFIDSVAENKKQLLGLVSENKLSWKHPLYGVFRRYINPNSRYYDPVFDKEIRKRAPHWFIDSPVEKKKQLLKLASGNKISQKHPLFESFRSYISPNSGCYDPEFDKEIRKRAPHWFVNQLTQRTIENKKQLLGLVNEKKFSTKHPLYKVLWSYTNSKSKCYDPVFDKEIRSRAPHWFKRRPPCTQS